MSVLQNKLTRAKKALMLERANGKKLKRRESELEKALEDATTDEQVAEVEAAIAEHETVLETHEDTLAELEETVDELKAEIDELENKLPPEDSDPTPSPESGAARGSAVTMFTRHKFFHGMSMDMRNRFLSDSNVKAFLQRTRELGKEKRSVTGAELNIPTIMLELLRDNLHRYSKLIKYINLKPVAGKARQTIAGNIPEGIWTEACAALNELNLTFAMVEVDGYKVGGFIAICNAVLEDSDVNLANEIMDALGQAIGFAVDKAILYGTGAKMPIGIMTRLAQTAKPAYWNDNMRSWENLSATNLLKVDISKAADVFYSALIVATAAAKGNYSTGEKFWAMNSLTYAKIMAKTLSFNAAGALVAAVDNTLPIIGGNVEILEFVPDGDIVGGHGSLYLLAERSEAKLAQSEHVRFIEDQTVFKGTARYDGTPVISEGFVGVNINNVAPTTSVAFAPDDANTEPDPGESEG